jgi:NitT/TauT family transport system substrate-binding protein
MHFSLRARTGAWFVAVFALVFSLSPTESTSADLRNVTVSANGISATIWPLLVAQERGFFTEAGVKIDLLQSGSSAKSAQQTAAGSVNIGTSSTFDTFRAINGGANMKIFLNAQAAGTFMLFASKSVKSIRDLKGKRVITGGPKDITNLYWQAAARHYNLDPSKDVDLIFAGASTARFAALSANAVEAAILAPPLTFAAAEQGFTNLGLVVSYLGELSTNVWYVNMNWAKGHEADILAFVKAINRGAEFLLNSTNRQAASEILAKATNIHIGEALKTYDLCVLQAKAYVADGSISRSGLERVRMLLDEAGDLQRPLKPIETFFDGGYLSTAQK